MVRGDCCFPSKQRLNERQKYEVNYHFASHAPINSKSLILEGPYMITITSLKLCNHNLRNMIIVSHNTEVTIKIRHKYKKANVFNNDCIDIIKNTPHMFGSMWLDGMRTMRTQYEFFMMPFKLKKLLNGAYIGFTYTLRGCSRDETNNLLAKFEQEVTTYGYSIKQNAIMKNNEHTRGNQVYTTFYNVTKL